MMTRAQLFRAHAALRHAQLYVIFSGNPADRLAWEEALSILDHAHYAVLRQDFSLRPHHCPGCAIYMRRAAKGTAA